MTLVPDQQFYTPPVVVQLQQWQVLVPSILGYAEQRLREPHRLSASTDIYSPTREQVVEEAKRIAMLITGEAW